MSTGLDYCDKVESGLVAIEPTQEAPKKKKIQESYNHDRGLNFRLQSREMFNKTKGYMEDNFKPFPSVDKSKLFCNA